MQSADILYSVPVSEPGPNRSSIYRNPLSVDKLETNLEDPVDCLYDIFARNVSKYPDKPCFGDRNLEGPITYKWLSYGEVSKKVGQIGNLIEEEDLMTTEDRFVGIYSSNRSEWMITDLAINKVGCTTVPILSYAISSSIIEETNVKTMFVSLKSLEALLDCQDMFQVKNVICFDAVDEEIKAKCNAKNLKLWHFWDDFCYKKEVEPKSKFESIYTIAQTSGSTGKPKLA